jgi:parvulin-like peptidyl-prolyl isomerase
MRFLLMTTAIASFLFVTEAHFSVAQEESPDFIAAKVNGESIVLAEVDAVLKAGLPSAPLTALQRRDLRRAILEDLIDDNLLRQFLVKHAPKVEAEELDAQLAALKASLVKENCTYEEYLRRSNQTESQLRETWSARIRLANYVKQIATDEKLKAYHAANRDHFDKVKVRVSHILIRLGRDATQVDRAAAREELQRIRAELSSGRLSFPAAARKYSQCATGIKNGDLGFIRRRGLPEDEPLAGAAFALSVGGMSDVIESDRGFHLLMVTDRKPGTPSVLEKCVVEVLEAFTEDIRAELVKKLRKEGSVRIMLP